MPEPPQFEVYLYVADAEEGEDLHRFTSEHWFTDPPDIETIAALFEEAKRHFSLLYPDVDPENFSVDLRRLRPQDLIGQHPPGPSNRP